MYKSCYNHWDDKRFPGYLSSMNTLYDNSVSKYMQNDLSKSKNEINVLNQMFGYLEYYYAAILKLGYVGNKNFSSILEQLKKIHLLKVMDPTLRDKFNGLTKDGKIMINPNPGLLAGLTQNESLQLTIYHELGHIITSSNKEDLAYLNKLIGNEKKYVIEQIPKGVSALKSGFDLLDEVASHNVAEAVLYERLKRKRPSLSIYKNEKIYPEGTFASNFLEYQEFEELAYTFACCLSFISHQNNDSMCDVLNRLSKAMFSRDFCKNIYWELTQNQEKASDLVKMLMCMGKIKEAKYASFGFPSENNTELNVSKYYKQFYAIAAKYNHSEEGKVKQKIQA